MQFRDFFQLVKSENFIRKKEDIFNVFAQNVDRRYSVEPTRRGGSSGFLRSPYNKKNTGIREIGKFLYTPVLLYICFVK